MSAFYTPSRYALQVIRPITDVAHQQTTLWVKAMNLETGEILGTTTDPRQAGAFFLEQVDRFVREGSVVAVLFGFAGQVAKYLNPKD